MDPGYIQEVQSMYPILTHAYNITSHIASEETGWGAGDITSAGTGKAEAPQIPKGFESTVGIQVVTQ